MPGIYNVSENSYGRQLAALTSAMPQIEGDAERYKVSITPDRAVFGIHGERQLLDSAAAAGLYRCMDGSGAAVDSKPNMTFERQGDDAVIMSGEELNGWPKFQYAAEPPNRSTLHVTTAGRAGIHYARAVSEQYGPTHIIVAKHRYAKPKVFAEPILRELLNESKLRLNLQQAARPSNGDLIL